MAQNLPIPVVFVPRDSFFHRLHPLAKAVWAIGAVVIAFATRNPLVLLIIFALGLIFIAVARVLPAYGQVMRLLLPISLSLIVFQALAPAFPQPWTPIANLGPFTIYQEGIYSGLSLLMRAWAGSSFAVLLVLTTHPGDLFAALQKLGVPHELNFMVSASLQLVPIVQREFQIVLSAQRSRGMRPRGFASVLPSMVPVFAGTIERVQQLALSLESRAFGSKGAKTSLRDIKASPKDYLFALAGVVVTVIVTYYVLANSVALDWSKTAFMPGWAAVAMVVAAAAIFLTFTVMVWRRASQD
ncbi:MAG: energy-coupling factor transporter transmembrane protein EcfT [Anaerolineales bacterium]|nr:energy-coupling factor transporter transmembrane protein EcfT [Anaerolineales bacterium]